MEKLIELLNEYEDTLAFEGYTPPKWGDIQDWVVFEKDFCEDLDEPRDLTMNVTHLISHRFGFIKWLVENDKIDTSKANDKNLNGYEIELRIRAVKELVADSEEKTVLYLNLLMILAISDTPIDFLCEILK